MPIDGILDNGTTEPFLFDAKIQSFGVEPPVHDKGGNL